MTKIFEDYFTDIQAKMISGCLDYVGEVAEKIYIYGSIEGSVISFDAFYKVKDNLLYGHEINNFLSESKKIDDSSDRELTLLRSGIANLEDIKELCEKYNMETPTEIKIEYNVLHSSMKADYK